MHIIIALALVSAQFAQPPHGGGKRAHLGITLVVGQTESLNLAYTPSKMTCDDDQVVGLKLAHDDVTATGKAVGHTICQFVQPDSGDVDHIKFAVVDKDKD